VREAVDIARSEDKTSSKLKRILSRFVLAMAGCPSASSRGGVVAAEQVQQVRGFQSRGSISQPLINRGNAIPVFSRKNRAYWRSPSPMAANPAPFSSKAFWCSRNCATCSPQKIQP